MFPTYLAITLGLISLGAMWLFFASGMPFGAGFQPAPRKAIRRMVELSKPEGKVVYDLGSGFGRVLFEAAGTHPSVCVGVEIDPLKCWWVRREARRRGLQDRVKVLRANLLRADLSEADAVFVFLTPGLMRKLKRKVLEEMKYGSIIVSYDHMFGSWTPESADAETKLYLYRVPLKEPAGFEDECPSK